jgi:hypothetical protein
MLPRVAVGELVLVHCPDDVPTPAIVRELLEKRDSVLVHYIGWRPEWDSPVSCKHLCLTPDGRRDCAERVRRLVRAMRRCRARGGAYRIGDWVRLVNTSTGVAGAAANIMDKCFRKKSENDLKYRLMFFIQHAKTSDQLHDNWVTAKQIEGPIPAPEKRRGLRGDVLNAGRAADPTELEYIEDFRELLSRLENSLHGVHISSGGPDRSEVGAHGACSPMEEASRLAPARSEDTTTTAAAAAAAAAAATTTAAASQVAQFKPPRVRQAATTKLGGGELGGGSGDRKRNEAAPDYFTASSASSVSSRAATARAPKAKTTNRSGSARSSSSTASFQCAEEQLSSQNIVVMLPPSRKRTAEQPPQQQQSKKRRKPFEPSRSSSSSSSGGADGSSGRGGDGSGSSGTALKKLPSTMAAAGPNHQKPSLVEQTSLVKKTAPNSADAQSTNSIRARSGRDAKATVANPAAAAAVRKPASIALPRKFSLKQRLQSKCLAAGHRLSLPS